MGRYTNSEEYLLRAEKTIPLGTQTFSKGGRIVFPFGVSPYAITHGEGSHVWDVDGNEYIDYFTGGAAINLGHNDENVTRAVQEQLKKGVLFSLPHPLEAQVAERLVELIPCAEMARFGKNGSDATAAAIRLARAHTQRDHVAVCGYHGWQDWYIGSTSRNLGVPLAVRALTHTFEYNDLGSLQDLFAQHPEQIAAVILEPLSWTQPPAPGFLESVKKIAHHNGALLIFDEMITGFRVSRGGAQELFAVTPDLATFGKALANGFPLSAVCGRAEIMKLMEEIYFSLTYGGETLSLAAALATMNKLVAEPVIDSMTNAGRRLRSGIEQIVARHGAGDIVSIHGHPTCTVVQCNDVLGYSQWQIRTLYMQEMLARGILTVGVHFMSYAHTDADIERTLEAYEEVVPVIKNGVESRTLEALLRCKPMAPYFKLRRS